MAVHGEGRSRRRELLEALLEEEGDLSPAQMAALVRELRRGRSGPDTLQGFVWGVGVGALLLALFPAARVSLRPLALAGVKGALDLADRVRTLLAEAGAGLQDLVAEAQFERLRDAAGPENDAPAPPPG